jgi:zinc protease
MLDRSKPPAEQKKFAFNVPIHKNFFLENGIEVNFVQKDKLPLIYAEIIIFNGAKLDPDNKHGLCNLTAKLIDEGAAEYNSLQLNDEFEKLGISFSVSSDHDITTLSVLSLKEHFERAVELLFKIITAPRFAVEDFEREKKKVLSTILQLKEEPSYIANSVFNRCLFGNSLYAMPEIGFEYSVIEITNSDIINFYEKNFSPAKAKIIIVGNITEKESENIFNKYFAKWNILSQETPEFIIPHRQKSCIYFVHKKDSTQSEIRIGHISKKGNSADYIPSKIMNSILGGQFSSRINLNLREKKGFTYGAGSSFHYYKEAGVFEVSTAVKSENTGEAVADIIADLNGIRKNISKEEIEFAKSFLIKKHPSRFETYIQVAKNIETLILLSLPSDELVNYPGKVENTTDEDVQLAAVNNILPDESCIVVVGDKEKIYDQLKLVNGKEPVELNIYGERLK